MKKSLLLFIVALLLVSSVSAALTDSLVSYYKFDGDATDEIGNNDGNPLNVTNTTGKLNGAYDFDGTSGYIGYSKSFHTTGSDNDFSASAWIYPNNIDASSVKTILFDMPTLNTDNAFVWFILDGKMRVYRFKGTGSQQMEYFISSSVSITINAWQYVGFSYNSTSSQVTFYNNGTSEIVSKSGDDTANPGTGYRVGSGGIANWYMDGIIDEVAIWDNLTQSIDNFNSLYNSGSGLAYPFSAPEPPATPSNISVILNTPLNDYHTNDENLIFSYNYSHDLGAVGNCTLLFNNTGWSRSNILAEYLLNTNANDETGTYDGTISGGVSNATGINGLSNTAYSFDSTGEYISISAITLDKDNSSISFWVYANNISGTYAGINYIFGNANKYQNYIGLYNTGVFVIESNTNNDYWHPSGATLPHEQWVNVVISANNGNISTYVDGALLGTKIATDDFTLTKFSNSLADTYFNGSIDNVRVWSRALNSSEVYSLYVEGLEVINTSVTNGSTVYAQPIIGVSDGVYDWYATCTDGNTSAISSTSNTFVIDTINPDVIITFPIANATYNDNLYVSFTMNDSYIWGYGFNISDSSGNIKYSESVINYTSTFEEITKLIDTTYWLNDTYRFQLQVADTHTKQSIADYEIDDKKKSKINFKTETDNNIKIETRESSTITATKEIDRYTFNMLFDDGLTRTRVFDVKTDCKTYYLSNSIYQGHFISTCDGINGNWVDFVGSGENIQVSKVDDYHYIVTLDNVPSNVTFRSIGGLNVVRYDYNFTFNGDWVLWNFIATKKYTSTRIPTFILNITGQENKSVQDLEDAQGHAKLIVNGSKTYDVTLTNGAGYYDYTASIDFTSASNPYNFILFNKKLNVSVYDEYTNTSIESGNLTFNILSYYENYPVNKSFILNVTDAALANITFFTDYAGGYYNTSINNINVTYPLVINLTKYFRVYNTSYLNYKVYNNTNYTNTIFYSINYTCPDIFRANLLLNSEDTLLNNNVLSCNNIPAYRVLNYTPTNEGVLNTELYFNTSYLSSLNNASGETGSFIIDLYAPNITILNFTAEDGFKNASTLVSLKCVDTIAPILDYNLSFNNALLYLNNKTANSTQTNTSILIDGINNASATCKDFLYNTSASNSFNVYVKSFVLIDEVTGGVFNHNNLSSTRVYFDDNKTYWDFKTNGSAYVNFTGTLNNKLRFEFIDDGINGNDETINRYIDLSLVNGDNRICVNLNNVIHNEQLIYSAAEKVAVVKSIFADCLITADYTRFAYQDTFLLKFFTIDRNYYLYTEDAGNRVFLSGLDGSIPSTINLDVLEFNKDSFNIDLLSSAVSFTKTGTNEITIYYKNLDTATTALNIDIYNMDDNALLYSNADFDNFSDVQIIFDYSTLNVTTSTLFKIIVTKTNANGETILKKYFNINGSSGGLSVGFAVAISLFLVFFGFTFASVRVVFSWFGIIIVLGAIGLLAFTIQEWYVIMLEAIYAVVLIYTAVVTFKQNENTLT